MAASEIELCIDESDLITSFSNPNYTLSCNNNTLHGGFDIQCHGNSSLMHANRSCDELGNVQMLPVITGDSESGNIILYHKEDTRSLTDSAISSPSSDSALASPCVTAPNDRREAVANVTVHLNSSENYNKKPENEVLDGSKVAIEAHGEGQSRSEVTEELVLPPGWQKCEDIDGPYYWHIKSGSIQREVPELNADQLSVSLSASLSSINVLASSPDTPSGKSCTSAVIEGENLEKETKTLPEQQYPIRFAVRSLGWVPIAEEDLSQEKSSRTVNKCIIDLSSGKKDINDVVGRWGDGKYLFMDLDQENLSLIDPHDLTVLNVQPIKAIRVWGVGRDNGRDFAYVARDRISRKFMCHVFRCELPARHIASTLCEICKKVIAKRNAVKALGNDASGHIGRPTNLPSLEKSTDNGVGNQTAGCDDILKSSSFPTPMDEPKKVMSCYYLGTTQVSMATGIEVLNGAIDLLNVRIPREQWTFVNVTVAPSTITITEHQSPDDIIAECRVRFLSFLGISVKNIKMCSFIMHTAQDQFVAHVFYCEPSAGAMCKIIEAACKLRYQKCLDRTVSDLNSTSPLDQRQEHSESPSLATKVSQCPESFAEESYSGLWPHSLLVRGRAGLTSSASMLSSAVTSLKTGFIETASSVKVGVAATSVAVKDELSNRASVVKDGITNTFENLRLKASQYLPNDQQL